MVKIAIAIHGGAGTILKEKMTADREIEYRSLLDKSVAAAYRILEDGGTAVDAVEKAVVIMEDSPLFNAGRGSVFTSEGVHEMDASIMDGKSLNAGACALVQNVKNPISLARLIMEKSDHVFLASTGAEKFARKNNCMFETSEYFFDKNRFQQLEECRRNDQIQLDHSSSKTDEKFGTVGAVALDQYGNLASATSTGGMTNKKHGRIGDSPIIGSGTYANNETCAISCTGAGEYFIRGVAAYDVSCLIEYKKLDLNEACHEVVWKRLKRIGGDGGLIGVDVQGNICMDFNTDGMYRASINGDGEKIVEIYGI